MVILFVYYLYYKIRTFVCPILPQILIIVVFLDLSGLTSFVGYCQYGSNLGNLIGIVSSNSAVECYHECQKIPKNECVAFSYSSADSIECDMYRDGPYIYGNGAFGSRCYLMQQIGIFRLARYSRKSFLFEI